MRPDDEAYSLNATYYITVATYTRPCRLRVRCSLSSSKSGVLHELAQSIQGAEDLYAHNIKRFLYASATRLRHNASGALARAGILEGNSALGASRPAAGKARWAGGRETAEPSVLAGEFTLDESSGLGVGVEDVVGGGAQAEEGGGRGRGENENEEERASEETGALLEVEEGRVLLAQTLRGQRPLRAQRPRSAPVRASFGSFNAMNPQRAAAGRLV